MQTAQFFVCHKTLEALRVLVHVLDHDWNASLLVPMDANGSREEVLHKITLANLLDVDATIAHLGPLTIGDELFEALDTGIDNRLFFQFDVTVHGLTSGAFHVDVDGITLDVIHAIVRNQMLLHELLDFGNCEVEGNLESLLSALLNNFRV